MILADKIIELRKKSGMSQEELAEKLGVSRQSVSKWEGAQSTPDLNRILQLSEIFGVSTEKNKKSALLLAVGIFLCIICLIPLIILDNLTSFGDAVGTPIMFALVAIAVTLFIISGQKMKKFEYLEKEGIDTEYGVSGMVSEKKTKFEPKYNLSIVIGVVLFILSIVPTIIIESILGENKITEAVEPSLLFLFVAVGVAIIKRSSTIMNGYHKLLEEESFTREKKAKKSSPSPALVIFWCIAASLYIVLSFITKRWDLTWLIWVIAGILTPVVIILFPKKNN